MQIEIELNNHLIELLNLILQMGQANPRVIKTILIKSAGDLERKAENLLRGTILRDEWVDMAIAAHDGSVVDTAAAWRETSRLHAEIADNIDDLMSQLVELGRL